MLAYVMATDRLQGRLCILSYLIGEAASAYFTLVETCLYCLGRSTFGEGLKALHIPNSYTAHIKDVSREETQTIALCDSEKADMREQGRPSLRRLDDNVSIVQVTSRSRRNYTFTLQKTTHIIAELPSLLPMLPPNQYL